MELKLIKLCVFAITGFVNHSIKQGFVLIFSFIYASKGIPIVLIRKKQMDCCFESKICLCFFGEKKKKNEIVGIEPA